MPTHLFSQHIQVLLEIKFCLPDLSASIMNRLVCKKKHNHLLHICFKMNTLNTQRIFHFLGGCAKGGDELAKSIKSGGFAIKSLSVWILWDKGKIGINKLDLRPCSWNRLSSACKWFYGCLKHFFLLKYSSFGHISDLRFITWSGWGLTIGSPKTCSFEGDPMVWPYPWDVILYARSSYYYDNIFIICLFSDIFLIL